MRILSIGLVRGVLAGLAGTGAGVGITMLVRRAAGIPAWAPDQVLGVGILAGVVVYLFALGSFDGWLRWARGAPERPLKESGRSWTRYLNYDTNHKVIGVQYMITALAFMVFAVILQLIGRLHMSKLGPGLVDTGTYNSIISAHGVVMLFIVVLPALGGLINYMIPLLIGARDMAFPRLNALTFWLVPPAGLLAAFALAAGGFDTGWTAYPPLSVINPPGMTLVLLGVYIGGLSSILSAVNILTTIFKMRAPGMSFFRMPVFVWSSLATTGLALVFTQFVAVAFIMVFLERVLGMGFFQPQMGGNVILYQHLFWFYSHPAVYIFVLPGLGVIGEVLPVFARKPLFGYRAVALSSPGIAFGGSLVWGHHMFAAGIEPWLRIPLMVTTLLVAVPTGVKVFSWVATVWMGKIRLKTPMLFVLSALLIFLIGGLTGVPLGIVPVDLYVTDTYFIVAHFHGTLFGGFLFPLMGAIYYWFPKATGRMLRESLGRIQWLLMTVGAVLLILPMFGLGLEGMRRRVADYTVASFQPLHFTTMIGGFLVFAGLVILFYNIVASVRRGETAGPNPWEGRTLEWQVSSPPPEENFEEIPRVVDYPYGYGIPGARHAIMNPPGPGKEERER